MPADPQSIPAGLAHLIAQSIEGLVVIAPQVRVFRALAAQSLDIPYVTLQSTDLDPDHTLSVDQIAGARLATKHLINLGHRQIYHLAGPQDWIEAEARMRGFLEEMSASDIPTTAPDPRGLDGGVRLLRRARAAAGAGLHGDLLVERPDGARAHPRDPRRGPRRAARHQRRRVRRHPRGGALLAAADDGPAGLRRARPPVRRAAARAGEATCGVPAQRPSRRSSIVRASTGPARWS